MTPSHLAALAASLSEAQRRWLLTTEATLQGIDLFPCAEWWDSPGRLYLEHGGQTIWLGYRSMVCPEGEATFTSGTERLTETGLALRNHILQEQDDA